MKESNGCPACGETSYSERRASTGTECRCTHCGGRLLRREITLSNVANRTAGPSGRRYMAALGAR